MKTEEEIELEKQTEKEYQEYKKQYDELNKLEKDELILKIILFRKEEKKWKKKFIVLSIIIFLII